MTPRVSVVVPTYKRPDFLERCLSALDKQTLAPREFEVIVADDGPTEETRTLIRSHGQRSHFHLVYVPVELTQGPSGARNAGWREAKADIIAFTDDDTVPEPSWLEEGLRAMTSDVAAGWGRIVVPLGEDPRDYEKDAAGLEHAEFATANCFVRREILCGVGGFDERFRVAWREDSDLFFSILEFLRDAGDERRVIRFENAVVVHPVRPAPWGISLSQQRKAFFNALLYKKHPRFYRERIQNAPPWHYYAAVASALTGMTALSFGETSLASAALLVWLALTTRLCLKRLTQSSKRFSHVAEMAVTSAVIPFLSVYWRLRGAFHYRVAFL